MRSLGVLGVLGAVGLAGFLAACDRGDEVLGALRTQPHALALERVALPLVPLSGEGAGSTVALVGQGDRRLAVVADEDAASVRVVDTKTDRAWAPTPLGGTPAQLVVGKDGRVYVAVRDRAEVDVLEVAPGGEDGLRIAARVSTAEEPMGLSLTPDGRTLLVACGWGHAVDAFATRTLEHRFRAAVAREPRSVVSSEDGSRAYVSHATSSVVSIVDLEAPEHEVEAVRLDAPDAMHDGQITQWRQGFALVRTEFGVMEPGVTAQTGDTTVRTETYGGVDATSLPAENFAVQVIYPHAPGGRGEGDVPSRLVASQMAAGCLLPRAAAYDPKGQWLLVACQGDDRVWRFDARPGGSSVGQAGWSVGGELAGVAIDAERRAVFAWSEHAHTLTSMPIDEWHPNTNEPDDSVHTTALGAPADMGDPVALGRKLFHQTGDTRISSDGRACASCHPDGRDDGLTWATPDGPRQTPTLAGRLAGTAPYGWNGARSTVKKHVRNTLKRLGGTGLDGASMNALVAYCMHMDAPPRAAEQGATAERAALVAEGQDLFESSATQCSSCHMSDGTFTDGNRHDVKSKAQGDPGRRFDTPSLRFVGGTAPYFHDGRYPTLRALLAGSDGKMGHTRQLSPHDVDALEAYLETL
ncbi:MAG TPA: cytochrome C peroxidase [Polyangiaceae bacterium]|jgi:mono/diheme cytochrome c family protein